MSRYIVFEHDPEPDFSWLEQDNYNPDHPSYEPVYHNRADMKRKRNPIEDYRNPDNHVALQMTVYNDTDGNHTRDEIIDSLGSIDFLRDSDDWVTGQFFYVNDIPKRCSYLRSLARDAGLRYRPRRKNTAA